MSYHRTAIQVPQDSFYVTENGPVKNKLFNRIVLELKVISRDCSNTAINSSYNPVDTIEGCFSNTIKKQKQKKTNPPPPKKPKTILTQPSLWPSVVAAAMSHSLILYHYNASHVCIYACIHVCLYICIPVFLLLSLMLEHKLLSEVYFLKVLTSRRSTCFVNICWRKKVVRRHLDGL